MEFSYFTFFSNVDYYMYKTDTSKGPTVKPLNSFLVVQEKGGREGLGPQKS